MILIADSGSSKTDWRVIHKNKEVSQYRSVGFNPFYQTSDEMIRELGQDFLINIQSEVERIFYYGAGCSSTKRVHEVEVALSICHWLILYTYLPTYLPTY